eukprot:m.200611 g.200611  ORF g.200611 m.200611 type:complete len:298 (+) comp21113_c0_seq1:210-1103(+)
MPTEAAPTEGPPKWKYGSGEPLRNKLTLGATETDRANKLMEGLFKMAGEKDPVERKAHAQRLLHSIAILEETMDKPMHAVAMNTREKRAYQNNRDEVDSQIEVSKQEVVAAKGKLLEARAKRRRQEEYDALAAVALEVPSRDASKAGIAELQEELLRLQADTDKVDEKFGLRKRQFQLLIHKAHDIRLILKADGELGDAEEAPEQTPTALAAAAAAAASAAAAAAVSTRHRTNSDDRRPAMYAGEVGASEDTPATDAVSDDKASASDKNDAAGSTDTPASGDAVAEDADDTAAMDTT